MPLFISVKFIAPTRARYFGAVTFLLGVVAVLGWSLDLRYLTTLNVSEVPMDLSSAVCFVLTGSALILQQIRNPLRLRLQSIFAGLIFLMSVAAALDSVFQLSIDLNRTLKSALQMPPAAIFGFALVAGLLAFTRHASKALAGKAIKIGNAALGTVGVIGLLSHVINMDYLYIRTDSKQMAFSAALGFIAAAAGLWCTWRNASWNVARPDQIAARHIYRTSDILLTVIVSTVSLVAFGLSQGRSEQLMMDQMTVVAKERRIYFENIFQLHLNQVAQVSSRPALISFVRNLVQSQPNHDPVRLAPLIASANSFALNGFSAVAYLDPSGAVLASSGRFVVQPELTIGIPGKYPSELMWKDGYVLRARLPLADDAGLAGYVLAEQPLPELTRMHHEAIHQGKTGDLPVCALRGDKLSCFPFRWNDHVATYPATLDGKTLPLARAAKGETATDITHDFRRQRVMAAFGPIGSMGIGMAVKMDMWELYAPIRKQFFIALPFLLMLVAGSIWLMRARLHPLVDALEKSKRDLSFLALHDSLTGIPNRMMFNDRLGQAMIRARRSKKILAVMYLDLDHFKAINDTFGHHVGDDVLRWFAAQLQKAVRASDTVARLGGDEFTIILENLSSKADAERIAQSIQKLVSEPDQALPINQIASVGASIGIAFYRDDETDPEQLLRRADAALYQCKRQGRAGYQIAVDADTRSAVV